MLPGFRWLVLWLPPLAVLFAGAVQEEEEAAVSVPRCQSLKETDLIKTSGSDCYCYNQDSQMKWMYMWSTVQVTVISPGLLRFVYLTGSRKCQHPETILTYIRCVIHNFWAPEESNAMIMVFGPYGETVCFSVQPLGRVSDYAIIVDRNIVDFRLFLVFVAGIFLFFYAKTLSQSPVFYYCSGTVLGIVMTLVFILLMAKRHIPKYNTFGVLMTGCWFASIYAVCQLMEDRSLWRDNRIYVLGYVLVVGLLSFAACYRHGPLADGWSRGLLLWTLRFLSLVLVYTGVAVPQFAYAVMILLLFSWTLRYPLRALSYLRRRMRSWLTADPPAVKYITDDEYREQAEYETARALEELRRACCRPDFPSWLAVSRLQAPKKFADFVLGASHLSPEEVSTHEKQYGLGGAFLEEQLFSLPTDGLPAS